MREIVGELPALDRSYFFLPASPNTIALTKAGHDALRRGETAIAREHFTHATKAGDADAAAWLGLAIACRDLKDPAGGFAAVERALALEPRNIQALIVRGDLFAETGDAQAATAHYAAALRQAPAQGQLTPALLDELRRAAQMRERFANEYEAYLRAQLAGKGFDPGRSSKRFTQSFEMSMGRKKIYLQQPHHYYFPELPQIQFYERKLFPWMDAVESATDAIAAELKNVMEDEAAFQPYVERVIDRPPPQDDSMTDNRDWAAFFLWKNGEIVEENAARCPETLRALEAVPQCRIAHRAPSILFSRLRPRAKIPPHNGMINTRLICHLPLIVPPGCGFRVGNDTREWRRGKLWAFDDTIEHEAWNNSDETRVVLIFEIWRPELSEEERELVAAMLEAVDSYRGRRVPWTDG